MTAKHTPAPWELSNLSRRIFAGQDCETFVAQCGDNYNDAKLIAAAPDLLEALEKLAKLGNGDEYGNSTGNMIARAAIAKAMQ